MLVFTLFQRHTFKVKKQNICNYYLLMYLLCMNIKPWTLSFISVKNISLTYVQEKIYPVKYPSHKLANKNLISPKSEIKKWQEKQWVKYSQYRARDMVFNATFNHNSVISWRSVLLVEETRVPRENHQPVASHWQTLSHNVASSTPGHERGSNSQR